MPWNDDWDPNDLAGGKPSARRHRHTEVATVSWLMMGLIFGVFLFTKTANKRFAHSLLVLFCQATATHKLPLYMAVDVQLFDVEECKKIFEFVIQCIVDTSHRFKIVCNGSFPANRANRRHPSGVVNPR